MEIGDVVRLKKFDDCKETMRTGLYKSSMGDYFGKNHEINYIDDYGRIQFEDTCGYTFEPSWIELPVKDEIIEYTFRDEGFNISQICADAFDDQMVAFLVVGNNSATIGVLGGDLEVDCEYKNLNDENYGYPYVVASIDLEDVGFWRKKLIQYSRDYKIWRKDLNDKIKDRSRVKVNDKKFKVMGFK